MTRALVLTSRGMNALFWAFGIALSVYLAGTATGLIRMSSSSQHYATFMFGVVSMSGFITLHELAERRLHNPAQAGHFFWVRFAIAWIATLMAFASSGYVRVYAIHLETSQPFFSAFDFYVGLVLVVSVLLLNWFHWGTLLTSIIGLSVVYFFYGYLIPYPLLTTPQYDPEFVMNYLGLGTNEGLFWFLREAADSIWFLVIFAGALFAVGTLKMVIEIGKAGGNRIAGGAAFPAIIGSGIVAAIMGTAVSNVVLTGRFTIPMMKSKGYSASMAGAIEATAGTAGQIMPPVLGLAAFIIAALLNMPYVDIALAAVIPGLLYMTGVTSGVLVYARRNRLPKLSEPVDIRLILRLAPTFLASFSVVMYMLLAYYTPSYAGLMGSLIALGLGLFQGAYRPRWPEVVSAFRDALSMAAILSLLLIAIGPLGQVFLTTNLSNRLGTILILILPNSELLLLIGAAILALILGMGLPTGGLHRRCPGAGAVSPAAWRRSADGAFFRVLFRVLLGTDAAGRGRRARRRENRESRFSRNCPRCHEVDADDLRHPVCLRLLPVADEFPAPEMGSSRADHHLFVAPMDGVGHLLRLFPPRPRYHRALDIRTNLLRWVRRPLRPRHLLEPVVWSDAPCDVRLHLPVEQCPKASAGRSPHICQNAAQAFR